MIFVCEVILCFDVNVWILEFDEIIVFDGDEGDDDEMIWGELWYNKSSDNVLLTNVLSLLSRFVMIFRCDRCCVWNELESEIDGSDGDEYDDAKMKWGELWYNKSSDNVLLTNVSSLFSKAVMILDDDEDFASESEILCFCV